MDATPSLRRRHQLANGARLLLRCIRAEDQDALRAGFERLSEESRYNRFHANVTTLSPAMLGYLTNVDGRDHFAVVALLEREGGEGALVGVGRFVRLAQEPEVAEWAITIADEHQRAGLGTLLFGVLVAAARERGIRSLLAYILARNTAVPQLLARFGRPSLRHALGGECLELDLDSVEPEAGALGLAG